MVILHRWREVTRRLVQKGIFLEINPKPFPLLIISGFTRSGTTYISRMLSSLLQARYIHEPLNPEVVKEASFFYSRESTSTILTNPSKIQTLKYVFSPSFRCHNKTKGLFKGSRDQGHTLFCKERIAKVVKGNCILDALSEIFPQTKFLIIIRNPASVISSRLRFNWRVPDNTHCIQDFLVKLSEQKRVVLEELLKQEKKSKHEDIAISWCIENFLAINNLKNPNFKLVFYENLLLSPLRQIVEILDFIDRDVPNKIIEREIGLYRLEAPREYTKLIKSWEDVLDNKKLHDIIEIVKIFDLDYLYNLPTGIPSKPYLFSEDFSDLL